MSKKCFEIHREVNIMCRMSFPFTNKVLPKNGVYILFEKGEFCHDGDRIVRIGTHTGEGALKERLLNHYYKGFKDRNIFRKNIGRAFLNKNNDDYLCKWDLNLRSKENREKYLPIIDIEFEKKLEESISKYIQDNISFVVIEENDKNRRLELERKLISEISNCHDCSPSKNWLGNYSTKNKIRESGLWQVNELYKNGFSNSEFEKFMNSLYSTKLKYCY